MELIKNSFETVVATHPFITVAIALAVGLVAGLFIRKRKKKD
jgi:LPXTG-motif cell wall-anchored protein